jgi:predicted NBD/HSP70 family sugar kinase
MSRDPEAPGDTTQAPLREGRHPGDRTTSRPPRPGLRTTGRAGSAARQRTLREHNLSLALRHVVDAPEPISRAAIATATGLTRATVSALVDRLVAAGMVTELEPVAAPKVGRPAVPLVPARGTIAAVGLEVNVDYLGVRAVDLSGRVVSERVEIGDHRGSDPRAVLDRLAQLAGGVVALLSADGVVIAGAALALPGLVDSVTGPLRLAPNLGWRDVDVVALLTEHPVLAGIPPRLANEAKLAARAEAYARRHDGPASFVYVSGEIGIGGAIVLDGETFLGQHGWSGEIGHTVVERPGTPGAVGTLETFAGQDALMTAAGLDRTQPISVLAQAADAGEPAAVGALEAGGAALGIAMANVVNIVDVGHVVLGGTFAELAAHLVQPVRRELSRRVLSAPWSEVAVSGARAGQYPAMTGGAVAVLRALVEDPAAWGAADDVVAAPTPA